MASVDRPSPPSLSTKQVAEVLRSLGRNELAERVQAILDKRAIGERVRRGSLGPDAHIGVLAALGLIVDDLWGYVAERERARLGSTVDPVLLAYHFTNNRRADDKGTIWYHANRGTTLEQALWLSCLYRPIGLTSVLSQIPRREELLAWTQEFTSCHQFTRRYGMNRGRQEDFRRMAAWLYEHFDELVIDVSSAQTPKGAIDALGKVFRFGPFLQWQVYCDLVEAKLLPFNENSFVVLGPGAQYGLRALKLSPTESALHFLYDGNSLALTLKDVEHIACEFYRYAKAWAHHKYLKLPGMSAAPSINSWKFS
mgnify:CR=1 FL=1